MTTTRRSLVLGALGGAALLPGCAVWRLPTVPMRTIRLDAPCAGADTLLVFLPGSFSGPEDFVEEGLVGAVRRRGIAADIVLVDAHLAYYSERSILDRLAADVVAPAMARGYRTVWFVGISIGAYGALAYFASGHVLAPGTEAGIVAIAPYLGDRRVALSVDGAGGLAAWPAPADPGPPNADDVRVWTWLQRATRTPGADGTPEIRLAYGASDRFAFAQHLLADALPAGRSRTIPGGHDWSTWRALWDATLPTLGLPARPGCRPLGPAVG